jgi:hypothetical protein
MRILLALLSGGFFGAGLHISGMTDTGKVQGFLDLFGAWDPTLVFVMGGAIVPMAIAWRMVPGRSPLAGGDIRLPTGTLLGQQTYTWVPLVRNRMGAYRSVPRASNRIAKLWEMDRRSFLYCNACRYVDRTFHGATPRQSECSRLNQDS